MNKQIKVFNDEFSEEESTSLANYIESGCPGLSKIADERVFQWFALYMSGKTFFEISQETKDKLELVLYIAHKSKWQATKLEYFQDIQTNLAKKVAMAKMEAANTMTSMMAALGKYHKKKADKYIMTNDDSLMESMDVKLWAAFCKTISTLDEMMNLESNKSGPSVNINVGNNASVSQKADGSLEVNSDSGVSDLLKSLAEFKKSQEKKV